jgi:hypothetical protein
VIALQITMRQFFCFFRFWSEVSEHSPETRLQIAAQVLEHQQQKEKGEDNDLSKPPKREYKLFNSDGQPVNVNEAKIPFVLTEDDDMNSLLLDVAVYKYVMVFWHLFHD